MAVNIVVNNKMFKCELTNVWMDINVIMKKHICRQLFTNVFVNIGNHRCTTLLLF